MSDLRSLPHAAATIVEESSRWFDDAIRVIQSRKTAPLAPSVDLA